MELVAKMGLKRYSLVLASLLILALVIVVAPTPAAIITIDNSSLNALATNISAMHDGDTLVLEPGTYFVSSVILSSGKNISITAAAGHGPSDTIIDGQSSYRFIYITDSSSLTLSNLALQNMNSENGGGGAIAASGPLTITGCQFYNCTSGTGDGGSIWFNPLHSAAYTLTITSSSFTKCTSKTTSEGGGAIFAWTGSTVNITSSSFTNCVVTILKGGAIYSSGPVTVTGSTITNCTASDTSGYGGGGAINGPQGGGTVTVTGSTITNCYANGADGIGGAISAQAINVSSSTISNCAAGGYGGALSSWSSVLLTNSSIVSCNTTTNWGGAISAQTVTVQSSQISNCTAGSNGGAIHSAGVTTLTSSTITACTAVTDGGAIYAGGNVNITGSTITNCLATGTSANGGGIFSGGSVTATSSTFSGCSCPSYAGEEEYTNNAGGAIYSTYGVNVSGSTFTNCGIASPDGWGGAIFVLTTQGETAPSPGSIIPAAYATVTNSVFTNCTGGWDGGAVYVQNGDLTVSSSTFTSCTDLNWDAYGGAIDARHEGSVGGILSVTSSTFTNCAAGDGYGLGGAIYSDNEAVVNQTTITNCSVIGADSDGGAIFSRGTAVLNQTTIIDCSAGGAGSLGGAVFAQGGNIQFSRLVNDNTTLAVVQGIFPAAPAGSQNPQNTGTAFSGEYPAMIATDNWWGTNSNVSSFVSNGVLYNPWLVLNVTATPAAITYYPLQTSTVQASLIYDSNGDNTYLPGSVVPDGIPVSFSVISGLGGVNPSQTLTASGVSQTTFTPTGTGTATVDATVDGYPAPVTISITGSAPTSHSHSAGTVYWENTGNTGTSSGYTGPSTTPAAGSPTQMPTVGHPTVMPTQPPTVNQPAPVSTTIPPVPTNTPKTGLDAVPILGAIGLCGAIFLFRKNGN